LVGILYEGFIMSFVLDFEQDRRGGCWINASHGLILCDNELELLVDIPDHIRHIQVVIFEKKRKGAWELKRSGLLKEWYTGDIDSYVCFYHRVDDFLDSLSPVGKPLYAEVYYFE
jgi:hypothetical protein